MKSRCKECNPVVCDKCSETFSKGLLKRHAKNCTGKINCSSGELAVMESLESLGFVKNETYFCDQSYDGVKDINVLRWDFRIETLGDPIFIEYDGRYHYFPIRASSSISQEQAEENLKTAQKRDQIKNDYCNNNCILLLRIPYWEKENISTLVTEFITTNLLMN